MMHGDRKSVDCTYIAQCTYKLFSKMTYKHSKLGQTDLDLGFWSEMIGSSVYAGLHVSMYSGYD